MLDTLDFAVHDIRRRQLDVLMANLPAAFNDHQARMSAAMSSGLLIVNDLAEEEPNLRELMTRIAVLAEHDPRLVFLQAIPEAPVLSMMRASALEREIFDKETRDVAELALLIGLYTVLLDGLLDEAPELLRPIKPWLDNLMTLELVAGPPPSTSHPVTDALVWAGARAVSRLPGLPGWADETTRNEFRRATRAAYDSELASVSCRISDGNTSIRDHTGTVLEKSTSCIWAGALLPFVVHGWPASIHPHAFESLAKSIGAFGGWIDDIVDLSVDLRADRWSMPLLEIYNLTSLLDARLDNGGDVRQVLAESLQHSLIAGRLPALGLSRIDRVRDCLTANGIPEARILPVLGDVARVCLLDDLIPA